MALDDFDPTLVSEPTDVWPDIDAILRGASPAISSLASSLAGSLIGGPATTVGSGFQSSFPADVQLAAMPRMLPGTTTTIPAVRASGVVGAILGRIRQVTGRYVSLGGVMSLVGKFGAGLVTTALGITAGELMTLMLAHQSKRGRRRRRGISSRDITRARSTIRRMSNFMARVQDACSPVRGTYRRRRGRSHATGCGCVVCRRG